ncbi:hypothetical protein IJ182_09080 [bacterium]|nr:hypothetical protein [bacterium]
MGLAASQGRYLCLTARNNDLVYEGQQISQQRVALAEKTQEVAQKYSDAMNKKTMQATVLIDGQNVQQQLTYDLLINRDTFSGLGMRIVDTNGDVVVPGEFVEIKKEEANKEATSKRMYSAEDFISAYMSDIDEATRLEIGSSITKASEYFMNTYKNSHPDTTVGLTTVAANSSNNYNGLVKDGEHTLTDENCLDPEYIQKMLNSGEWLLEQGQLKNAETNEYSYNSFVWQGSNNIIEVYDEKAAAAAEAEYEADMADLNKRDKVLELRLEQVETEQGAVEKELESVKQVIDKNIEDSFKTFA